MNERIKELAREAGEYADQTVHYYMGQFDGLTWEGKIKQTREQKFAELIVEECVKLCGHEANKDEYDQYDMGMSVKAENIKTAIKQHFGVES